MSTDAGSGFDKLAAGRDAGDEILKEGSRHLSEEDADDGVVEEEDRERKQSQDSVNDAF